MSSQRELEFLRADLQQVERLLNLIPADHNLERLGLEARRRELLDRVAAAGLVAGPLASVSVVFGGEPVLGAVGIDAKFGAKALDSFQRAVGAAAASRAGKELGQSGPVPEIQSRLLLTDVVHGSFGFTLEEITGEPDLWEQTALTGAVSDVEDVLESLSSDPEHFPDAASDVDPRVIIALREFVGIVNGAGATFRVSTSRGVVAFPSPADVEAAHEQLSTFTVREDHLPLSGVLLGILPVARRFELRRPDGTVIRGRIGREIEDPESLRRWEDTNCTAYVRVVTVDRPEKPSPPRYTLQRDSADPSH